MKTILCNKYFFINGGTEKYLYDLSAELRNLGHTPIPFSVSYANSWPSEYSRFFLPPPSPLGVAHYAQIQLGMFNWIKYFDRGIYSFEARSRLSRLLNAVGDVDIAYVLNIYNYMSPSIIHTFKNHGIPVVMRLGDYNLLCPSYLFLRDSKPCTLCIKGDYCNGIRYRCLKNSLLVSFARCFSMYLYKRMRIYDYVSAFVVPCLFMKSKLIEGGFPEDKIHLIRTPVAMPDEPPSRAKKPYILYFGRISYEKGLDTLIQAVQQARPSVDLVLIGRSYDGEQQRLERLIRPEFKTRIRFLGFKQGEELSRWISEALFAVVPSRWYDNSPLSIYESYMHETCVLAAGIGGIPEQIDDGVTGRLFTADSVSSLKENMLLMLNDREKLLKMGRAGTEFVLKRHNMDTHLTQLLQLFESVRHAD